MGWPIANGRSGAIITSWLEGFRVFLFRALFALCLLAKTPIQSGVLLSNLLYPPDLRLLSLIPNVFIPRPF